MYQIYVLLFTSGHYYIGRSKDYKVRYSQHKHDLLNNKHGNPYLQRVYHLYGIPRCILLTYCIDCYSTEQILLDFNYGKEKCLNLSKSSLGGCVNSIPPILTRDIASRCVIKTKDFADLQRVLNLLPVAVVAKYYKVEISTLYNLCKTPNVSRIKRRCRTSILKILVDQLDNRLVEFVLDDFNLSVEELVVKYNVVNSDKVLYWREMYQKLYKTK